MSYIRMEIAELIRDLYLVPDVDNESVGNGLHGKPVAIFENLQPWYVILKKKSDDVRIGVRW